MKLSTLLYRKVFGLIGTCFLLPIIDVSEFSFPYCMWAINFDKTIYSANGLASSDELRTTNQSQCLQRVDIAAVIRYSNIIQHEKAPVDGDQVLPAVVHDPGVFADCPWLQYDFHSSVFYCALCHFHGNLKVSLKHHFECIANVKIIFLFNSIFRLKIICISCVFRKVLSVMTSYQKVILKSMKKVKCIKATLNLSFWA